MTELTLELNQASDEQQIDGKPKLNRRVNELKRNGSKEPRGASLQFPIMKAVGVDGRNRDVTTVGFQADPVLNCEAFAVRAESDWEIRHENRFIASSSLGHARPKRNFDAGDRAVANLSSEGGIPLDCRRHGNAEGSCFPSSQALGADARRGQFHAARARAIGGCGATLSPENAAASVLGNDMEGYVASRSGAACLAEPHHGRRHLGHNFCLPDERDLPVRGAVGLCVAEFHRRSR